MLNAVEWMIFPSPVNGATIPPIRNGTAPNRAAAMPRFSVMVRNARVMVAGVSRPTQKSMRNMNTSNNANNPSNNKASELNTAIATSTKVLRRVATSSFLILITTLLPATSPTALPAKHRLYSIGVSPK